ncbi:hypothetical protein Plhal304r1_c004g0018031 [Plasmopara halstedii]
MGGGQRLLTLDENRQIQEDVKRNTGVKLVQIQEWVRAKFKVNLSRSTAHRIIHTPEDVFSGP